MKEKKDIKKLIVPALMALLAVLLVLAMFLPDGGDAEKRQRSFYGLFDTVGYVMDYSNDSDQRFAENYELAHKVLEHYHRLFDIYGDHDGVSGLYDVNKNAGIAPVRVSSELIDFLEFSKEVYTLTGGEVNVVMGAVLSLWHDCRELAAFDPTGAKIPDAESLSEAAKHCDINKLIINREESTVYLEDERMSLDVGAVGKGYAVEMAAKRLAEAGADGYVLDVGGNIRIIGDKPSGDGFRTGIKNPLDSNGGYVKILTLSDTASVTSGGYERYYTVDGKRYHHIVDKDTLHPAERFASVTVITPDSGLADALSTALFCMDVEAGLSLVESLEDVEAVWVAPDGGAVCSSGIEAFLKR